MCSLFGLIDHDNVLSIKEKNRMLNALARESSAAARTPPASPTTLATDCASISVRCPRTA